MPLNTRDSNATTTDPHSYEPISMALTEDTMFVPPSPAFRKFNGSIKGGKGMDRPSSVATLPSQRNFQQDMGAEDVLFGPPSPGFREFNDNRPRSLGMPSNNPYQPFIAAGAVEGGEGPQDAPFVPPRSPARSVHSYRHPSTSSTLAGPSGLQSFPVMNPEEEQLSPPRANFQYEARQIDRPMSYSMGASPPMPTPRHEGRHEGHPLEEDITATPPNPSFLRSHEGSSADRPMSVA